MDLARQCDLLSRTVGLVARNTPNSWSHPSLHKSVRRERARAASLRAKLIATLHAIRGESTHIRARGDGRLVMALREHATKGRVGGCQFNNFTCMFMYNSFVQYSHSIMILQAAPSTPQATRSRVPDRPTRPASSSIVRCGFSSSMNCSCLYISISCAAHSHDLVERSQWAQLRGLLARAQHPFRAQRMYLATASLHEKPSVSRAVAHFLKRRYDSWHAEDWPTAARRDGDLRAPMQPWLWSLESSADCGDDGAKSGEKA